MADSATYSVGNTCNREYQPSSPTTAPRASATAIATAFVGCATQSVLQNSPALPRAARPGPLRRSARASPPRPPRQHRPAAAAAPPGPGCGRCWPCRRAAPPPALPCTATGGRWMVTLRSPWRSLVAHGVLQAVARGCLGHPLGRFAVGSTSSAPGRCCTIQSPAAARDLHQILTRSRGCRRSNRPCGLSVTI